MLCVCLGLLALGCLVRKIDDLSLVFFLRKRNQEIRRIRLLYLVLFEVFVLLVVRLDIFLN